MLNTVILQELGIEFYSSVLLLDKKQMVIGFLTGFRNVRYDDTFNHVILLKVIPALSKLWIHYETKS